MNKSLRIEDNSALYQLRFYILDLSEQLGLKFIEMKKTTKMLKLYRGLKLRLDEVANLQRSIGSLISFNGYLSTTSEHSRAYDFVIKATKIEGIARVLFEYEVDLETVHEIVVADIRQYLTFPEEAEHVFDIGKSIQR